MEQFLSAASTKRRRQKAAINFLGYITHFAMEFTTIPVAIIMITNEMAPLMAYIYLYPVLSLTGMVFNKPIQEELRTTSQILQSRFMSSVERLMGKFKREDFSLHPEVMMEEIPRNKLEKMEANQEGNSKSMGTNQANLSRKYSHLEEEAIEVIKHVEDFNDPETEGSHNAT